jgi:pimeloyl-ACP methyl ester carboxylesterase
MSEAVGYNEFGMLADNAAEADLPFAGPPAIARRSYDVSDGQSVSAIVWGASAPELVLLHGGGQNAHTWDTVALALGRPLIAIDLPGHGHSDRRADRGYGPWLNAEAVAAVLDQAAPDASAVIGMSLGGATAIRLAASRPDLVRKLVVVEATPQINDSARRMSHADRGAVALVAGPPLFDSFEAIAGAAVAASPRRSRSSVERGVRHNAVELPDGRWTWRYDLFGDLPADQFDFTPLWDDVSAITAPTMLVRGGDSKFVTDDDVAEFRRRQPGLRLEVVANAGHSVQGDQPLELRKLINDFVFS